MTSKVRDGAVENKLTATVLNNFLVVAASFGRYALFFFLFCEVNVCLKWIQTKQGKKNSPFSPKKNLPKGN